MHDNVLRIRVAEVMNHMYQEIRWNCVASQRSYYCVCLSWVKSLETVPKQIKLFFLLV